MFILGLEFKPGEEKKEELARGVFDRVLGIEYQEPTNKTNNSWNWEIDLSKKVFNGFVEELSSYCIALQDSGDIRGAVWEYNKDVWRGDNICPTCGLKIVVTSTAKVCFNCNFWEDVK